MGQPQAAGARGKSVNRLPAKIQKQNQRAADGSLLCFLMKMTMLILRLLPDNLLLLLLQEHPESA